MDKKLFEKYSVIDKIKFNTNDFKDKVSQKLEPVPVIGKAIRKSRHNPTHFGNMPILSPEEGKKIIVNAIESGKPFMAGRFGTTEGLAMMNGIKTYFKYGDDYSKFPQKHLDVLCSNAGFFPNDKKLAWKWVETEMKACEWVDLLGIMHFTNESWICQNLCPQATLTPNGALASARSNWTHALEGKKVLVVHPFTDTIKKQYTEKREKLFPGYNTLPEFDLKCVKAVQTIAGTKDSRFNDWFEALDYMTEEISKQDFDVCMLGCGAYGFTLAARVKQMGKIAIHMGGCLQTTFGIRGSRWDKNYSYLYNDAWVRPSEDEKPEGFNKIEGGCYW